MKQSNWILGIGVLVAIILIVGALFFSNENQVNESSSKETYKTEQNSRIFNIIAKPIESISAKLLLNH